MREGALKAEVIKWARRQGWTHRKVSYEGRGGAPDDWFFKAPGRLVIVEFKATGEEPTPRQAREIGRWREAGFSVHTIDSIEAGCALFD